MKKVQLTTEGIKKHLASTTPAQALVEYIWNGIDAKADMVDVSFEHNEANGLSSIIVKDNGKGIPYSLLEQKFGVFLESEKLKQRQSTKRISSEIHGKDGIGRLTFFKFCHDATWETIYEENGKKYRYRISISASNLVNYPELENEPSEVDSKAPTGTTVFFHNINSKIIDPDSSDLIQFIVCEFCWKLFLQKELEIKFNGRILSAHDNIEEEIKFCPILPAEPAAEIHYVRWKNKLHREYSRYYFIDNQDRERFTDFTSLNKKGDNFFHSVYVKSTFFDNFCIAAGHENQDELNFDNSSQKANWFKSIQHAADHFLRLVRKEFLKKSKDDLIDAFEKKNIFPHYNNKNQWEVLKHNHLAETIGELYNIQPKIFSSGSIEQKKIFVRLIEQLLDSSEADSLYQIIGQVLELEKEEKSELLSVLQSSRLSSVIKTVKLIQDRYRAIEHIKRLNWDKELGAREVPHIQEFMERHFWIIGEEYSVVVAAEKDFEQALRELYQKINMESHSYTIDHIDKNKEMDLLLVKQDHLNGKVHNIVLELKHPRIKLGKKQFDQITTYFGVIQSDPRFNAANMEWSYYIIGNDFDSTDYINSLMENAKPHGLDSLIFKTKNHKIYAKRWSELILCAELRHKFLNDRLEVQREILAKEAAEAETADQIIKKAKSLSCAL